MKSKMTGWVDVFYFTFIQGVKSKSLQVVTIILFAVAVLSLPVIGLIMDALNHKSEEKSSFDKVYVVDETGLGITDFSVVGDKNSRFADVEYVADSRGFKQVEGELKKADGKDSAIGMNIVPDNEMGGFLIKLYYGGNTDVSSDDLEEFGSEVSECYNDEILNVLPLTKEQLDEVNTPVETRVIQADDSGEEKKEETGSAISSLEYSVVYAILFIFLMCVSFSGDSVAGAVITEKSSRVIEFLMISVSPLALVVGKIIGRLLVVLCQVLVLGAGMIISTLIVAGAGIESSTADKIIDTVHTVASGETFAGLSPISLLLGLLILLVGFFFYGALAGLMAATVSKMEDASESMKVYVIALMLGAYLALAVIMTGLNGGGRVVLERVACLVPVSAPFIVPSYLWLGKTSLLMGFASLVLSVALLALILFITARIYENMIFHNGEILKVKDLVKLFKNSKKQKGGKLNAE